MHKCMNYNGEGSVTGRRPGFCSAGSGVKVGERQKVCMEQKAVI